MSFKQTARHFFYLLRPSALKRLAGKKKINNPPPNIQRKLTATSDTFVPPPLSIRPNLLSNEINAFEMLSFVLLVTNTPGASLLLPWRGGKKNTRGESIASYFITIITIIFVRSERVKRLSKCEGKAKALRQPGSRRYKLPKDPLSHFI